VKSDTVRLTYRGGVRGISMLAQMLEEQGVSVWYTPPRETRDMTEAAAIVVVVLSATGNIHDIAAAVQRFRQQFGARAQIEGLPEPKAVRGGATCGCRSAARRWEDNARRAHAAENPNPE
jgi:hypothetical protein